jgi:D-alanyl-D-alanine dipeptidase
VDLEITTPDGERLDMSSPFPITDRRSNRTDLRGLTPEARRNRDLLVATLTAAGLTNYPAEWWHWEYGTPGWALRAGQPAALYGLIEP